MKKWLSIVWTKSQPKNLFEIALLLYAHSLSLHGLLKCDRYLNVSYEYFPILNVQCMSVWEHCCTVHHKRNTVQKAILSLLPSIICSKWMCRLVVCHSVCHPHQIFHAHHANADSLDSLNAWSVCARYAHNSGQFPFQWDDNNSMSIIAKLD